MYTIKLLSMVNGQPTPFDGQYLRHYDPDKMGRDPNGKRMICELTTSPDIDDAAKFRTFQDAVSYYRRPHHDIPGIKPLRPLTAFTVEITKELKEDSKGDTNRGNQRGT